MRQAGRAHWITISGIVGVAVLVVLLFFTKEPPISVANRFMIALAKGDVDTLMDLSYYQGPKDKLKQEWDFAVHEAGPHYLFRWRTVTTKDHDENHAAILTQVERNLSENSYEEKIDIPMVKEDGKWKVDVKGLFRGLYPALPR